MDITEEKLVNAIGALAKTHKVGIGKHTINYLKSGSGPNLLLLHTGNIGWGQWYKNIHALSRSFTVYAVDLPGSGRSSLIDFATLDLEKDFIDVINKFIRKLDLEKVHIIGSSIGGWITLRLALMGENYLNKIVLVDSLGFTNKLRLLDRILSIKPLAHLLVRTALKPDQTNPNIERFLRSILFDRKQHISSIFLDYFCKTLQRSHILLLFSRMSKLAGMPKEFILKEKLRNVTVDTLIIWGKYDPTLPLKNNKPSFHAIPNSKVRIFLNSGHMPFFEEPEKFNTEVSNFLLS